MDKSVKRYREALVKGGEIAENTKLIKLESGDEEYVEKFHEGEFCKFRDKIKMIDLNPFTYQKEFLTMSKLDTQVIADKIQSNTIKNMTTAESKDIMARILAKNRDLQEEIKDLKISSGITEKKEKEKWFKQTNVPFFEDKNGNLYL